MLRGSFYHASLLGMFTISGIQQSLRCVPQINECFEIDVDGILNVSTEDHTTGAKKNGQLSKGDTERMIWDAQKYKLEDERHKKKVQAKNAFEGYALDMMDAIEFQSVGITHAAAAKKKKTEGAINGVLTWLDNNQLAETHEFECKLKELKRVCSTLYRYAVRS